MWCRKVSSCCMVRAIQAHSKAEWNLVRSATFPIHAQSYINLVSVLVNGVHRNQTSVSKTNLVSPTQKIGCVMLLEQTITTSKHGKHKGM